MWVRSEDHILQIALEPCHHSDHCDQGGHTEEDPTDRDQCDQRDETSLPTGGEISPGYVPFESLHYSRFTPVAWSGRGSHPGSMRSEEHTSELQSRGHLVCRLLL